MTDTICKDKELADLERLAKLQDWEVEYTGGGHIRWTSSSQRVVITGSTPGGGFNNDKQRLIKAGLIVTRAELRRAARAERRELAQTRTLNAPPPTTNTGVAGEVDPARWVCEHGCGRALETPGQQAAHHRVCWAKPRGEVNPDLLREPEPVVVAAAPARVPGRLQCKYCPHVATRADNLPRHEEKHEKVAAAGGDIHALISKGGRPKGSRNKGGYNAGKIEGPMPPPRASVMIVPTPAPKLEPLERVEQQRAADAIAKSVPRRVSLPREAKVNESTMDTLVHVVFPNGIPYESETMMVAAEWIDNTRKFLAALGVD